MSLSDRSRSSWSAVAHTISSNSDSRCKTAFSYGRLSSAAVDMIASVNPCWNTSTPTENLSSRNTCLSTNLIPPQNFSGVTLHLEPGTSPRSITASRFPVGSLPPGIHKSFAPASFPFGTRRLSSRVPAGALK